MKAGTHRAKCIGAVMSETKEGRERAHLKFALVDDANDAIGWDGYFGDNIDKGNKSLTERTFDVLHLCGMQGYDLRNIGQCASAGKEVEIVVIEDEYRGAVNLKVRFVQEVGTAAKFMPKPMAQSRADSFAERMKARMEAKKNGGSGGDDDLPF